VKLGRTYIREFPFNPDDDTAQPGKAQEGA
jgi:hypothetical protein